VVHQDQHLKKILFARVCIFQIRSFIVLFLFAKKLAVDGSMVRPRFPNDREQKRDSSESRNPMRDTKRRQEFMK